MRCRPTETREKHIYEMTPEEVRDALLVDPVTRMPNLRAWREMEKGSARAWIDADGPEWLADQHHRALCEPHLRAIAAALGESMPGHVAYLYGDFFAAHASTPLDLEMGIGRALRTLSTVQTQMTRLDGAMLVMYGLGFSHWQTSDLPAYAAETYDIRGFACEKEFVVPAGGRLPARLKPLLKAGYQITQVRLTMPDGTIKDC